MPRALLVLCGLLSLAAYTGAHENPPDCLAYLGAERAFQEKIGKMPDLKRIEIGLSKIPVQPGGGPWERYEKAYDSLKWATEGRDRLWEADNQQQLLVGKSVPLYSTKAKVAHESVLKALTEVRDAGKALKGWLKTHGIDDERASLFMSFVGAYREGHEILGPPAPDLVFRVAVHERQTMCPT